MGLLTLTLVGQLDSVEIAQTIIEDLRAVAVKAGCPADSVRVGVRWQGRGSPAEITVECVKSESMPGWTPPEASER